MPTYDYACQACGHEFERWQEMTAPKLKTCPECGRRRLVRLVGAGAGVIFRGSGFYETDYKRKASAAASGTGKKGDPASSSSPPASSSSSSSSSSSGKESAGSGKAGGTSGS